MGNQVRIIMMNPPSIMPSYMADFDGFFSLELRSKERIALTKKIDEYADVGTIKQDTFKEISVTITKKNKLLFEAIGNPNALNQNNNKVFDIQLLCGDYTYPVTGLQIVGVDESSNAWQCVIFGDSAGWVRFLAKTYLNTIDLGSEVCTDNFVKNVLPQKHAYVDGDYPVFAPLVNYGEWFINHNIVDFSAQSQVVFNNYRFWYSQLALMKKVFCMAGYELIAPILETDYYRRVWLYLLDPDFETVNQADIANRPFEATENADTPLSLTNDSAVFFSPVISDPGSHTFVLPSSPPPSYRGFFYSAGVIGDFKSSGRIAFTNPLPQILLPSDPENLTVKISIRKAPRYGINTQEELMERSTVLAYQEIIRVNPIGPGIIVNFDWDISTGDIRAYQHEVVFIIFEIYAYLVESGTGIVHDGVFVRGNSVQKAGCTFYLNPSLQVIEKGDTLDFGAMLRKDKTALDLVKGIAHLHNLKVETDVIGRKVYMYPEFKVDLPFMWIQEAYFKDNQTEPFEATDEIQVKSLQQGFINTELNRYAYLKFLDSTDGFIQQQNFLRELHSKYYDFGDEYVEAENKIENPFFEPTMLAEDGKIGINDPTNPPTFEIKTVNYIPFLWESQPSNFGEYPSRGYDFAPRLGIAYEYALDIRAFKGFTTSLQGSVYEDTFNYQNNCFGQVFQTTPYQIQYYAVSGGGLVSDPRLSIVYGLAPNDYAAGSDLWQMIYRRSIAQAYFNIAIKLMAEIDLLVFSKLSFRQKWHLVYNSVAWGQIDIYCRLSYLNDYVIGENILTPIELIPDTNNFTLCTD